LSLEEELEQLEECRAQGDQPGAANCLFRIGCIQAKKGESQEALSAFQEAYDICKVKGNDKSRLEVLRRVVGVLLELDRLEEAEAGLETGLSLADKLGYLPGRVDFLDLAAQLASKAGRPAEAVSRLEEAAAICQEHHDAVGELLLLEKLGPALRADSQYDQALEVYRRLADLAGQAGDLTRQALALVGVGQISQLLGRPNEVLTPLEAAEKLYLKGGFKMWADMVRAEIDRLANESLGLRGS